MPDMDGFTVAERIRKDPSLHRPAIMMITSSDIKGDAARCRELGIARYLVKPVKQAELLHSIRKALECDNQAAALGVAPPAETRNPKGIRLHVLVAEDNAVNQILVGALLEQRGWKATMVTNGSEALEALASDAFDVVLMDVQMPEMDGFEATRILRAQEAQAGRHVPVIGLTAHAMKGDREMCLEAGMDDYLAKPVDPESLYAAIERCVAGHGRLVPAADLADLLQGIHEDRTLLAMLVNTFLKDLPPKMEHLRDAVRREDALGVRETAHALKGMLLIFRAQPALTMVAELEERGRKSRFDSAAALLRELDAELERLAALLSEACASASKPVSSQG
jgi:CheY-like chemotaxis protein